MQHPRPPTRAADFAIFTKEFYESVAHEMDPTQEIDNDAVEYLDAIARCFIMEILEELKHDQHRKIEPGPVTPSDVYYILQTRYKMTVPGATGRAPMDVPPKPTSEYDDKLRAVRAAASQADD